MICSSCSCDIFNVEEVAVGWDLIADKITCCDCGYVEYVNERNCEEGD